MTKSALQIARAAYQPKLPKALASGAVKAVAGAATQSVADQEAIKALFPNTYGMPLITFEAGEAVALPAMNVGVILSGGQAPGGHNVISGLFDGIKKLNPDNKLYGFILGPGGLVDHNYMELTADIIDEYRNTGGFDIIGSGRTKLEAESQFEKGFEIIKELGIKALVIIGGDGSLTGARIFAQEFDVPCIGLPGTIDNDLYGTDFTIGYDTALNTIVECVDKIRDTATSHDRIFFVEVMGRDAGFLAQNSAIASGAEAAIIPEDRTDADQLETFIGRGFRKTKNSSIVIVTESPGNKNGGAMHYADRVKREYPGYDVRVSILGHLQRGGAPSANDRILASRLGEAAIQALMEDQHNIMVGIHNNEIVYVPFDQAIKNDKPIDKNLIRVLNELSI